MTSYARENSSSREAESPGRFSPGALTRKQGHQVGFSRRGLFLFHLFPLFQVVPRPGLDGFLSVSRNAALLRRRWFVPVPPR